MRLLEFYRSYVPEELRLFVHRRLKPRKLHGHTLDPSQRLLTEAKAHYAKWELEPALQLIEEALALKPRVQKALQMRGQVLLAMGDHDGAHRAANALLEQYPIDRQGRKQLIALGVTPPPASKETALQFCLANAERPSFYVQGAQYLYDAELFQDALDFCTLGFAALADEANSRRRSSVALDLTKIKADSLEALQGYEEAQAVFAELLRDKTSRTRGAAGIARCLFELGEPSKAEDILRAAYASGVDPLPWSPLMLDIFQAQGKIRESYEFYRKKPVSKAIADYFGMDDPQEIDLTSGEYRAKSALLLAEGGPGDELRLCSIYLELKEHFGHLCISSEPRLVEIMRRTFPEVDFLPVGRYRTEVARDMSDRQGVDDSRIIQCVSTDAVAYGRSVDFTASILDTLADVRPDRQSFLAAKRRSLIPLPELKAAWQEKLSGSNRPQIGIAWRSMLSSTARNRHYFPVEYLAPFADLKHADFWILQPRVRDEELEHLSSLLSIRIPQGLDLVDDLEGQLALTSCLDGVVSPFTATGELAAATGVPTVFVSGTRSTLWRRNDDGSDIFARNARIVAGDPIHDKASAIQAAADSLLSMFPTP